MSKGPLLEVKEDCWECVVEAVCGAGPGGAKVILAQEDGQAQPQAPESSSEDLQEGALTGATEVLYMQQFWPH